MKKLEFMTEPELKEYMNNCGYALDIIAEKMGVERPRFVLVLFNDPKVAQYIANCDRGSMIEAMRETADRLAGNQDVPR